MSIKVDPTKLEELSVHLKQLERTVEGGEHQIYSIISQLIREIRSEYSEWEVQQALNEVEDDLREIRKQAAIVTEGLARKSNALSQAAGQYQDKERTAQVMIEQYQLPSSYYTPGGGLADEGADNYLKDQWFEDPVVQELHLKAMNGTEEEQKEAKEKLDAIFQARNTIARAQVAYAVYKAFGNQALMTHAHKEATKQRKILKEYGIHEDLYGERVKLDHLYPGSPLSACSYDPSLQIIKDNKPILILMPQDNQYIYLLSLIKKGESPGAWARKQLDEIHKLLSEIGRAQVAWHEYKAKDMKKEMDGAHIYAEKLRTILKEKYSLSSEMVDDTDYKFMWTGAGAAGKYLNVEEHSKKLDDSPGSGNLVTADDYRQAIIEEAKYWIGKIPYCRDTIITTQVLDKNNPPPYMDCSDFTSSVYLTLLNIKIGAATKDQIQRGTEVSRKDLKPGDLILFGDKKKNPNHVGIYIGNGEFIHEVGNNTNPKNLTTKGWNVKIGKLTSDHWSPLYLSARRIIQDNNTIINKPNSEPIPLPKTEKEIKNDVPTKVDTPSNYNFEKELAKFPETYRPLLQKLHAQHPEWIFYAENINADFNKLVAKEMDSGHVCTSEEKYGYKGKWKDPKYKYDPNYFAASEQAVSYFIDPRNFINETQIFQFFSAKYDKGTQNLRDVNKVLEKAKFPNKGNVFLEAGGQKVSAIFLAAKSCVETGMGKSRLAEGKVPGYSGWYNMYGIGAFDGNAGSGGAKKAKAMGWDTQDKAIIGGGNWIYENYVSKGQDTLYKMKWNIEEFERKGTVSHQYATHIKDASLKASIFAKGLKDMKAPLVFRIPIFKNMPADISKEPNSAQSR